MSDQKNLGQQVGQYTIQRDDNSWKVVRTTQDFTRTGRDKGDNTVSPPRRDDAS
jgi:hypothetical protein